eukprot:389188_1
MIFAKRGRSKRPNLYVCRPMKLIEYLNTVAIAPSVYHHLWSLSCNGWHTMQFAIEYNGPHFLRKFLSLYPTADSKRDIIFRTDLSYHDSFFIGFADWNRIECWDILWQEIEEFCKDDESRDEIITNYLNVQKTFDSKGRPGRNGDTGLMILLREHETKDFFFKALNHYPSLLSKQEALKIKNEQGQDALQILNANSNWD